MYMCVFAEDNVQERQHRMFRGRRVRRTDTNILSINFTTLSEPSDVHTGDAVICSNGNCAAILSHFSELEQPEDQQAMEKVREGGCGSTKFMMSCGWGLLKEKGAYS